GKIRIVKPVGVLELLHREERRKPRDESVRADRKRLARYPHRGIVNEIERRNARINRPLHRDRQAGLQRGNAGLQRGGVGLQGSYVLGESRDLGLIILWVDRRIFRRIGSHILLGDRELGLRSPQRILRLLLRNL